uniref:Uncharacterized protein n=1 Tax=Opuntia streptacantha TaxID=393608 RepID=A0A7C9D6P1_OPUST
MSCLPMTRITRTGRLTGIRGHRARPQEGPEVVGVRKVRMGVVVLRGGSGFRYHGLLAPLHLPGATMRVGLGIIVIITALILARTRGINKVAIKGRSRGRKAWIEG